MAEHKAHVGLMIPLGAAHGEPDGDESDEDEDGDLGDHEYQSEADDVLEAIKNDDHKAFAHALEIFVKKCMGE